VQIVLLLTFSREEGESWVKELEDDVRTECEKNYGHVVHISLDPNTQGDIYLKFDKVSGGEAAILGLNGALLWRPTNQCSTCGGRGVQQPFLAHQSAVMMSDLHIYTQKRARNLDRNSDTKNRYQSTRANN